jgi:hypothetical protein
MPGLTDRDLRRIERFVRTSPNRRTPRMLVPTEGEGADGGPTPENGCVHGDGHGDREGRNEPGG